MPPRMEDRDGPAERRQQQKSVAGQHAGPRPIECQRIQQYDDAGQSGDEAQAAP